MTRINNCAHDWDEPEHPLLNSERTCRRCGAVEIMAPDDTLIGNDSPVWQTVKRGGSGP